MKDVFFRQGKREQRHARAGGGDSNVYVHIESAQYSISNVTGQCFFLGVTAVRGWGGVEWV